MYVFPGIFLFRALCSAVVVGMVPLCIIFWHSSCTRGGVLGAGDAAKGVVEAIPPPCSSPEGLCIDAGRVDNQSSSVCVGRLPSRKVCSTILHMDLCDALAFSSSVECEGFLSDSSRWQYPRTSQYLTMRRTVSASMPSLTPHVLLQVPCCLIL